ncbi:MAG: efflux RND transporter permease subunit [Opitutaceae bacterium]|tara:strand:+ start:4642 stop:7785 length:3144 start_codon:yes stop_codon:yes gene_type:complete
MKRNPYNDTSEAGGLFAWFARNHVAANLLMIAVVVVGVLVAMNIRQEIYPTYAVDTVEVSMQYRGASPEEVEQSIILPIESELRGLEMTKRILSSATEGSARVTLEILPGFDRNRALQEVTAAVARISLFPDEIEPPRVSLGSSRRRGVCYVAVGGEMDPRTMSQFAHQIEDGLLAQPEISLVSLSGVRRPEILIEVPQANLRSLGLTLGEIAQAIDRSALDVPAGSMKTKAGEVLLKTTERRYFGSEFAGIPIKSSNTGAEIKLGDIATIEDGFEETEREDYFNGRTAVSVSIEASDNQSPLEVSAAVHRFIAQLKPTLPPTAVVEIRYDRTEDYMERINLLRVNGTFGLVLVLLALGLLLELRVAFWTAVGIPVSILGSLILLPLMDASVNMISVFGFIVTLGIVVDDAVVVGEDIFHKITQGMSRMDAAVAGVKEMTMPVVFAVSTNIIAFLPLFFVPGESGRFLKVLPAVIIAVFTVSLIEVLLILPSHLAMTKKKANPNSFFSRLDSKQTALRVRLDKAMENFYRPILMSAIRHRYITITVFSAGLLVLLAYTFSGRVNFTFNPTIENDYIQGEIEMPTGTPVERTREVAFMVEAAAKRAIQKIADSGDTNIVRNINVSVASSGSNAARVAIKLVGQGDREITGAGFVNVWREEVPEIPDIESLFFDYLVGPGGEAEINIQLAHPEIDTLRRAAEELGDLVAQYPGVTDIRKGFGREMPQISFEIKPAGQALGITARDLGQQIRHAFYGAEALRQPREREELRVMVRLPLEDRRSMGGLEDLLIRAPNGAEIPIRQAAEIIKSTAPARINRVGGGRVVNVTANVVHSITNGNKVLSAMEKTELPELLARYPGLRYSFEGDQRDQREASTSLSIGLLAALFAIFAIMASLLKSYSQSAIVLLTIPWGVAGSVLGHIVLGFDLSIYSVLGMIALCGMVVNGGFVLAVTQNRYVARGLTATEAIIQSAERRFRPIFLTSVTTFLGLGPMIFETSEQALFLVPMAISLGVGTLASSMVVLILMPVVMMIIEEAKALAEGIELADSG